MFIVACQHEGRAPSWGGFGGDPIPFAPDNIFPILLVCVWQPLLLKPLALPPMTLIFGMGVDIDHGISISHKFKTKVKEKKQEKFIF